MLGVGIIGAGGIAEWHARGLLANRKKAKILGVADVDEVRAKEKANRWGATCWHTDYRHLLEREDINAVVVCTPNCYHAQITCAAAEAGKHILCEKPIATTLADADWMIKTCRKNKVKLQIGYQLRYHPYFLKVKELIDKGEIGKTISIRGRMSHDWGGIEKAPTASRSWFAVKNLSGGGTLLDNGCHYFDLLRYLVGEIKEVFAYTTSFIEDKDVEDNAVALCRFKNKAIGQVEASWTDRRGWDSRLLVYGTLGVIECIDYIVDGELKLYSRSRNPKIYWKPQGFEEQMKVNITQFKCVGENPYLSQISDFLKAVEEDREPGCSGEDGRASLEVVLAAYRSAKTGQAVSLPLNYDEGTNVR
jgi:predicted dehydrogenase